MAEDTLTITDNRTGHEYTLPIADGTIRATDLQQIRAEGDDAGLMAYDPAYLNTASCRSAITYIDGDAGILRYRGYPIEQLAEEATFLETAFLLLEGELPTAEQLRRVGGGRPVPHVRPHERPEVPRGLPLRRAPDGDAARCGRGPVDVLPGREGHRRPRRALPPARPADGEAADDRRVRLPARARAPVRPAAQRPRLHRQLREHDVRDRRAARAERRPAAGARDPPRPARRPRAELLDERRPRGRVVARRPVLGGLGRDRGALRPAPRRRQRGGAPDARPDRRRRRTCPASSSR